MSLIILSVETVGGIVSWQQNCRIKPRKYDLLKESALKINKLRNFYINLDIEKQYVKVTENATHLSILISCFAKSITMLKPKIDSKFTNSEYYMEWEIGK